MAHGERTGRRTAPGAVIAVAVVMALALAALALRPAEGLLHSGRGPLGRSGFLAIGASLAWTFGVWTAVENVRHRFGADRTPPSPVEERLREAAGPLLLAAVGLVGVLALVLHRFSTGDDTSGPPPPGAADPMPTPTAAGTPPPRLRHGAPEPSSLPLHLVLALAAAVAAAFVVVAVVRRLRRFGLRVPQRPGPAGTAPPDEDARLLLSAVDSGRRALADGGEDAREAVIACYAAMEDALAVSGVPRRASDSPADLLSRAVGAGFAPGPAPARLTALFREARYSSHPMDGSHRAAAAAALEALAALLGEPAGNGERASRPDPEAGR
ncbi:uncharacterized protein DUF4129 [Streptomyces sp. BK208]|uniref:DUF4129 domain-containing protein n=1 Tax=Streptomyces sp. BK208 TaxID=2512150 RepID=UPI0010D56086|nr:DUF4129 domain-containing protein [Streptomyces sp. BK208]TDT39835.1 uncharacterized protein DUF4129 [Streptomyces sp. BK208]